VPEHETRVRPLIGLRFVAADVKEADLTIPE
jgi:hypothetical protein